MTTINKGDKMSLGLATKQMSIPVNLHKRLFALKKSLQQHKGHYIPAYLVLDEAITLLEKSLGK